MATKSESEFVGPDKSAVFFGTAISMSLYTFGNVLFTLYSLPDLCDKPASVI